MFGWGTFCARPQLGEKETRGRLGGEIRRARPLSNMQPDPPSTEHLRRDPEMRRVWSHHKYCEWAAVVGGRIRRLRHEREMTLKELGEAIDNPLGLLGYSHSYLSRIERGHAYAPIFVYLGVAHALGVPPGILLGPDSAALPVSEAELVLLRSLREMRIEPHEAILRLTTPREGFEPPT
jgi:transcriptional regulator with XRE-family HTH domain